MVWSRTILDDIVVCLIFNVTVALLWMMIPNAFSKMLPAEIRKASPKRREKDILILASVLYPLYILIFVYMALSVQDRLESVAFGIYFGRAMWKCFL